MITLFTNTVIRVYFTVSVKGSELPFKSNSGVTLCFQSIPGAFISHMKPEEAVKFLLMQVNVVDISSLRAGICF